MTGAIATFYAVAVLSTSTVKTSSDTVKPSVHVFDSAPSPSPVIIMPPGSATITRPPKKGYPETCGPDDCGKEPQ